MKTMKFGLKLLIVLTLFLVAIGTVLLTYQKTYHLTFPQKTIISGTDISGMKSPEAKDTISKQIEEFRNQNIELKFNGNSKSFSINELSPVFDLEQTLSQVRLVDLSGNFLAKIFEKSVDINLPLIINIDEEKLEKLFLESFELDDISPKNANYYFNDKNALEILEETDGFVLNKEKLFNEMVSDFSNLKSRTYELELLEKSPVITKKDIEDLSDMQSKLSNKITLIDPVFSDNWNIKLNDYKTWVKFIPDDSSKTIIIEIVPEEFDLYINDKISKWLDRPAEDVNIKKNEDGKIEIEGKGKDGTVIKRKLFYELLANTANSKTSSVLIPIEKLEPKINIPEDLKNIGINERIGVGHTSYYGSPANRVHNIKVGAEKFNGKLIAPGEIFSFNTNLGPVNGATGYRKELVIKKEGTIPEFGGGLCQLSTTFYRAILFSGLPVTDRRPHTYAVSYYSQILGHGLDATIYLGGQDLKFENDTGHHILVQTYVEDNFELFVVFYGTSDGRTIEMEGPYLSNYHSPGATQYVTTTTLAPGQQKQVEKRHTGFKALWYRHLSFPDGTTKKETINSPYRAVPAKILVGAE